jgi:hypothetical protein
VRTFAHAYVRLPSAACASDWLPSWPAGEPPLNASVRASISPEVLLTVWGAVPLAVKPKLLVGMHFGGPASAVPEHAPWLGVPSNVAPSLLPPLRHVMAPSTSAGHVPFASGDRLCADGDEYALSSGLNLGVGIGDVRVPSTLSPLFGGADLTIVGGVDFAEASVVPEATFPACGQLCRGCLSDYARRATQLEREAFASSADAAVAAAASPTADSSGGGGGWVAVVVVVLLLAGGGGAALAWRRWERRRDALMHTPSAVPPARDAPLASASTVDEVVAGFGGLGLGRYARALRRHSVDGPMLAEIAATPGALADLGVRNLVHQIVLRRALGCSSAGASAAAQTATVAGLLPVIPGVLPVGGGGARPPSRVKPPPPPPPRARVGDDGAPPRYGSCCSERL